jgi:CO/xanthine dehydrogenase Mo-binding subunit
MLNQQRRDFLKSGGALVVTFTLAPQWAHSAASQSKSLAADSVDGYVAIDAKGMVTLYSGKVDLGTGVNTALTQIAADELSVPFDQVTLVTGDTALTPEQGITWGSLTIQAGGMQIRQACATAREALIDEAAARLGVPRRQLAAEGGVVAPKAGGKSIPYGRLIGGKEFNLKLDAKAPLKSPADYNLVGRPVQRLDIPDKVTGRFTYVHDFKIKGMLHARVVRPAAIKASLQGYDDSGCKSIPGYVAAVRKGDFLAVLATDEWAAVRAAGAIKAKWSHWEGLPPKAELWEHVRKSKLAKDEVFQNVGNTAAALPGAARTLSAVYDFAVHTHGSMGPSCAVANYKDGKLTVWTASQATHLLRRQLATMLGIKADAVRCIYLEGSGCYGRNGHEDAAADAALLAKETAKPVRVQWTRADEHGWDPKGPPTLLEHRAGLDANGNVVAWESQVWIPDRPKGFEVTLVAAELSGLPKDTAFPGNIHQGLAIPYAFPNIKATAKWLAETPFKPSWIRTPGRMQNTFANESFLDELAARMHRALRTAGELASADGKKPIFRRRGARPRLLLHQVRAGAHLRRDGRRRGGEPPDRRGQGRALLRRARLRADHQPRRPEKPDRRQRRADSEPHAHRGAPMGPFQGHQPRLAELPDPQVPRRARGGDGSHRPAERAAVGRG